ARLELLLQLHGVRLAVDDTLLAALELLALRVDLGLALVYALFDLRHLEAAVLDLGLDLRPERHSLLTRLDLCLAPGRLRLAFGFGEERAPLVLREAQARRAHRAQPDPEAGGADRDSDHHCDDREHARSLSGYPTAEAGGLLNPDTACTGGLPVNRSC